MESTLTPALRRRALRDTADAYDAVERYRLSITWTDDDTAELATVREVSR